MLTKQPQPPVENVEHSPSTLAAVAEAALRDHGAAVLRMAPEIAAGMQRLGAWAWEGEGPAEGVRELIIATAEALFRSPADTYYGRPLLADPRADDWLEKLLQAVGSDTPLA